MVQYQDIWVRGERRSKGVQECESRYEMIAEVASRFKRPFTVLDIGANLGYFSIRLAEDFDCTVLAVEDAYSNWLREVLDQNGNKRIIAVSRKMTIDDMKILADVEHFDLTLAMSSTHHFDAPYREIIKQLRRMGIASVLEITAETAPFGQDLMRGTSVSENCSVIGYAPPHLGGRNPLVLMEDDKVKLERSYWGTPLDDCDVAVEASYAEKWKVQRGSIAPWHRGVNLNTWLKMGPLWPPKLKVLDIVAQSMPTEPHGDLRPHNIVFQGDGAVFIDAMDPRRRPLNDEKCWMEIVEALSS